MGSDDLFILEQQLLLSARQISVQMKELRRLRELVCLEERRFGIAPTREPNWRSENHRGARRLSTSHQASVGARRVLTTFLRLDPGSEILVLPVDRADA